MGNCCIMVAPSIKQHANPDILHRTAMVGVPPTGRSFVSSSRWWQATSYGRHPQKATWNIQAKKYGKNDSKQTHSRSLSLQTPDDDCSGRCWHLYPHFIIAPH